MLKIGITGQAGFIGKHIYNTIGLSPEKYKLIAFEKAFFESENDLNKFVSNCDIIIHLAAMNRHNDVNVIYNNNINLVKQLILSLERTNSRPHVIFSSSTQEESDNLYGKSKSEGRELLIEWAKKNHAKFTGLIIPNVFGPFGKPYYNSVIATFCHQFSHGEIPTVNGDNQLNLI